MTKRDEEAKALQNEVLPSPTRAPTQDVRARVVKHVREVMLAGATMLVTGCPPFAVVDPLPPPAKCRTVGSVKDLLTASATETTGDGGSRTMRVLLEGFGTSGAAYTDGTAQSLRGAVVVSNTAVGDLQLDFTPDLGGRIASCALPLLCTDFRAGAYTEKLTVTVTLSATAGEAPVVSLAESITDAGR